MSTFMVVGDVHGNLDFATKMCDIASKQKIKQIYQVGDFGLWDHTPDGVEFLDRLNEYATLTDVVWYWIPGNHENYDRLDFYRGAQQKDDEGFLRMRSRIRCTDRTHVWEHDGVIFGAVGGAVSIDRGYRKVGESYWPAEMTTNEDVSLFKDKMKRHFNVIDVLLTHDAPTTLPEWEGFVKNDNLSHTNREKMDFVYSSARARVAFHGHYHRHLAYLHDNTAVIGLSCDDDGASWWGGDYRNYAIVSTPNYVVDVYSSDDGSHRNYLV